MLEPLSEDRDSSVGIANCYGLDGPVIKMIKSVKEHVRPYPVDSLTNETYRPLFVGDHYFWVWLHFAHSSWNWKFSFRGGQPIGKILKILGDTSTLLTFPSELSVV